MKSLLAITIVATFSVACFGQSSMQEKYRDAMEIQQNGEIIDSLRNIENQGSRSSLSDDMVQIQYINQLKIENNALRKENALLEREMKFYRMIVKDVSEKVPGAEKRIEDFIKIIRPE